MPDFIAPQLATLVKEPPPGNDWFHELKFDGYRLVCHINRGKVQFWTRNQKNWTHKFSALLESTKALPATTAIIDGEVVVMDAEGRTSFQKLQQALGAGRAAVIIYQVFDLIYLDGFDLTRTPLRERKRLLEELFNSAGSTGRLRYSDHVEGNGSAFFKQACNFGLEGMVSKLASSFYDSTRNRNWLKVKCIKRQEFVIAGYTPSSKGLPGFGSLVLGVYEDGNLVYCGRVGTGFSFKQRLELKKKLDSIHRAASPFDNLPKDPGLREAHWAEPKLVGEVEFIEWTSEGLIRHPSFQGLRDDKTAQEVRRELPQIS
ncbi:MAG: non-homologous end-joining DNA ligase, partial [Blastocatellia bacterium]